MLPTRRIFLAALAVSCSFPQRLLGDTRAYPDRPVRLVLPNTAGGTSDVIARLLAPAVGAALGESLVIDARPGAAGRIAVDHVAAAAPDGYTLLLANNGTQAIAPAGRGTSPADAAKTLAPVSMLARAPLVIAVSPQLGVDSLAALVERARTAPVRLAYASGGAGSTSHMAADLFARRAGIALQHVPYSGTAAAIRDVLSGEVPIVFTQLGTIAPLLGAGQLRALALTGARRLPSQPELPTVAEAGYRGFEISTWYGVMVPVGTPAPVVARLHAAFAAALAAPELRRQFATLGIEPVGDAPAEFAATLHADLQRWREFVRAHGRSD